MVQPLVVDGISGTIPRMDLGASLFEALSPVVDMVFPPRCPLCGSAIAAQNGLCAACWSALAIPGQPACRSCARPFGAGIPDGATCAPCLAEPPRHDGIAAATLYNETSRKLVLALKYGRKLSLAPWMAALMAAKLPPVDKDWLYIPVPLHRWRLWSRGYNQAAEIARAMARQTQACLAVDGLIRKKKTPSLGGLGAKARERVLRGAIAVRPRWQSRIAGARIVLVDDVLTSGATTNACIRALKRAGAQQVIVACFARVMDETMHANHNRVEG